MRYQTLQVGVCTIGCPALQPKAFSNWGMLETTPFTLPCAKNAGWFADRDFNHMHHERGPVSRIYASVLEPGAVAVGDAAVLEPR